MTKEEYDKLKPVQQKIVFDEMLELISLIYNNPISIEHFKVLTEWINHTGIDDVRLKTILLGICPTMKLNDSYKDEGKVLDLLKCSEEVSRLTFYWNRVLKMHLRELYKIEKDGVLR